MTPRYLPLLAALNALVTIIFGAFAAHVIREPQAREWITTGVIFQLPHVAAVFALLGWRNTPKVRGGAWLLGIGSLLFAGSLDALAVGLPRSFAALAPVGGALMIVGWAWVAVVALARPASGD
jgi:uncharacterized membrane protein YgdD (TMEM256/DUF423 family)